MYNKNKSRPSTEQVPQYSVSGQLLFIGMVNVAECNIGIDSAVYGILIVVTGPSHCLSVSIGQGYKCFFVVMDRSILSMIDCARPSVQTAARSKKLPRLG